MSISNENKFALVDSKSSLNFVQGDMVSIEQGIIAQNEIIKKLMQYSAGLRFQNKVSTGVAESIALQLKTETQKRKALEEELAKRKGGHEDIARISKLFNSGIMTKLIDSETGDLAAAIDKEEKELKARLNM